MRSSSPGIYPGEKKDTHGFNHGRVKNVAEGSCALPFPSFYVPRVI